MDISNPLQGRKYDYFVSIPVSFPGFFYRRKSAYQNAVNGRERERNKRGGHYIWENIEFNSFLKFLTTFLYINIVNMLSSAPLFFYRKELYVFSDFRPKQILSARLATDIHIFLCDAWNPLRDFKAWQPVG